MHWRGRLLPEPRICSNLLSLQAKGVILADVFISYSRTDRPVAERLCRDLGLLGLTVWMDDQLEGGSTFKKAIEAELNAAGKIVVLWSKTSVDSDWVCDEAQAGRDQGKLVPLTIDGTLPPLGFRQVQTIQAAQWASGKTRELPEQLLAALRVEYSGETVENGSRSGRIGRRPLFLLLAGFVLALAAVWGIGAGLKSLEMGEEHIVVMPFESSGSDLDEKPLAAGITAELITRLRRIDGLQVSTGTVGNQARSHALFGTVRKDSDRLRVSVRLEDPGGKVLWSENFDSELVDLLRFEEMTAKAVAETLEVSLDLGDSSRSYGGTDSPEAYAAYIQGRSYRYYTDRAKPTSYLQRAVAIDPEFVKGWEELSYIYGVSLYSARTQEEADRYMGLLDDASRKAMELNRELWNGLSARGWYDVARDDLRAADEKFRRVAELDNGKDPTLRETLAIFEQQIGRVRKASEIYRSMSLIDPSFETSSIEEYFYLGRSDEILRTLAQQPETIAAMSKGPPNQLYWIYVDAGEYEKARNLATANSWGPPYNEVPNYRFDPDYFPDLPLPDLRKMADRKFGVGGRRELLNLAMFASLAGDQATAMDYLRLAFERPGYGNYFRIWYPALKALRQTKSFEDWVKERGIVDIWRASGDWGDFCEPEAGDEIRCH